MASVNPNVAQAFRDAPPEARAFVPADALNNSSAIITPLSEADEEEALKTLAAPSLTNVIMSGFIHDNGLVSPHNRGRFYACLNGHGEIEGVALIGHTILFEAFTDRAVEAFAASARQEPSAHLLMGRREAVQSFWNYYAGKEQSPRLLNPVLFLQQHSPTSVYPPASGLHPATPEDLDEVMNAQAAMALEMSGVDPLKSDPAGFRERCLRRIRMRRIWVLLEQGRLVFKADVMAETPEAAYIEGVYVSPQERGKGFGRRCLAEVVRRLLGRTKAIYLFVGNHETRVRAFYESVGFSFSGQYDLLYF